MSVRDPAREERRLSARLPVCRRVYLSGSTQRLKPCLTRDLGAGGTFVESRRLQVSPGERVDVFFVLDLPRVTRIRRLKAKVVYWSEKGVGLAFEPGWRDLPTRTGSVGERKSVFQHSG